MNAAAAKAINDPNSVLYVSQTSLWEIILKHGVGKLFLPEPPRPWWKNQVEQWGLIELPITTESLFVSSELPKHHKDPFDRLILAQAKLHGCQIISSDSEFPAYGLPLAW